MAAFVSSSSFLTSSSFRNRSVPPLSSFTPRPCPSALPHRSAVALTASLAVDQAVATQVQVSTALAMPQHVVLADPRRNRDRRFSDEQRTEFKLHGLVHPAAARSLHHQVQRLLSQLAALPTPIARYERLMRLLAEDEQLFFATAQTNFARVLPLIYTPTVGDACVNFPNLDIPLRGVWLSAPLAGSLTSVLRNAASGPVDVIVVSDCQRILGLGDLGANGMPIPVGKLLLYSACGGVQPRRCLPVVLDVGCDVPAVREAEHYVGIPSPRITGAQYDDFIDEFITAVRDVFGRSCLIQFEDFGNANATRLLTKYRNDVCTFNDDIQGTAAVGLAGILAALRIPRVASHLEDHSFLFLGAGSAGIGIANLIVLALQRAGLSEEEARRKCHFVDSKGLVYDGRAGVSNLKAPYAHAVSADLQSAGKEGLAAVVRALRPSALIGVSTIRGAFTKEVLQEMGNMNEKPIIMALSNPTSKAECTAEEAYSYTDGRAVFASGSPFGPVRLDGWEQPLVPGQGNNSYIFPGLGLGVMVSKSRIVPDSMLLAAADRLASMVDNEQLSVGCVYPDLSGLMDISANIAYAVCQEAGRLGINDADLSDIDVGKIRALMYEPGRGQH